MKRIIAYSIKYLSSFFCLVCLFASASSASDNEIAVRLKRDKVDYAPVQGYFHPLKLHRDVLFAYTCNECHRVFDTVVGRKSRIAEHVDLKLNHGRNDNCLNCHHKTNRNAYVTHEGREISSDMPEELCAECHGMVYRDWKIGAHGRMTGSWNSAKHEKRFLVCTECHDPHNPKFPQLAPMPGPAIPGGTKERGDH